MDSCKILIGESKWILALGCEFLTLDNLLSVKLCRPMLLCLDQLLEL